jgi:hypothetical protein
MEMAGMSGTVLNRFDGMTTANGVAGMNRFDGMVVIRTNMVAGMNVTTVGATVVVAMEKGVVVVTCSNNIKVNSFF